MAVEISGVTLCPSDDLITGAWLDAPQTGPVDGYAFEVSGWVVSKAPVARWSSSTSKAWLRAAS